MERNVINRIVFVLTLGLLLSVQTVKAQEIDNKNKVEYISEGSDMEELNSISASMIKKMAGVPVRKVKKKNVDTQNISMEDLQKIANLRFRKKRNISEKCLKEAENECDSLEKKKHQLAKKKK